MSALRTMSGAVVGAARMFEEKAEGAETGTPGGCQSEGKGMKGTHRRGGRGSSEVRITGVVEMASDAGSRARAVTTRWPLGRCVIPRIPTERSQTVPGT